MDIDWITTVLSINDNHAIDFWKKLDNALNFNPADVAALAIINDMHYKQMMCDEPDYLFDPQTVARKYKSCMNYGISFIDMIDQLAIFALLPIETGIDRVIRRISITHPDPISINIGIMYIKLVRAYLKKEQININELVGHWRDTPQSLVQFTYEIQTLTPLNIKARESSIYIDIYSCYLMLKYKDIRYTNPPDFGYRVIFQKNRTPDLSIREIILRIFR